jgi:hypothetical protein
MHRQRRGVVGEETRQQGLAGRLPEILESAGQQRPPALGHQRTQGGFGQGRPARLGPQPVHGRDQVRGGVGKGTVEIEQHRPAGPATHSGFRATHR